MKKKKHEREKTLLSIYEFCKLCVCLFGLKKGGDCVCHKNGSSCSNNSLVILYLEITSQLKHVEHELNDDNRDSADQTRTNRPRKLRFSSGHFNCSSVRLLAPVHVREDTHTLRVKSLATPSHLIIFLSF